MICARAQRHPSNNYWVAKQHLLVGSPGLESSLDSDFESMYTFSSFEVEPSLDLRVQHAANTSAGFSTEPQTTCESSSAI